MPRPLFIPSNPAYFGRKYQDVRWFWGSILQRFVPPFPMFMIATNTNLNKAFSLIYPVRKSIATSMQRGSTILEGHMVQDHVHMLIKIPPKYAIAEVIGYIKGESAIAVARQFGGRKRNFNVEKLWARGYAVSTVGFEETQIKAYIRQQEQLDGKGSDENGMF